MKIGAEKMNAKSTTKGRRLSTFPRETSEKV
jgi:hypothetical protein